MTEQTATESPVKNYFLQWRIVEESQLLPGYFTAKVKAPTLPQAETNVLEALEPLTHHEPEAN